MKYQTHRTWLATWVLLGLFVLPSRTSAQLNPCDVPQIPTDKPPRGGLPSPECQKARFPADGRGQRAGGARSQEALFSKFQLAIPKFRSATEDYRLNLGSDKNRNKSLKNIQDQTDVLLNYLHARMQHPKVESSEFKGFKPAELRQETLSSAERIAALLDFAVAVEREDSVSVKNMNFLYSLDGELLRLKWLTSHTK